MDSNAIRNPFGVMDVPDPNDQDVSAFAANAMHVGSSSDKNAENWSVSSERKPFDSIDGEWSSRWNGGADPTIPGDAPDKWKSGRGEAKAVGARVYIVFDWDGGARRGLIDAERQGANKLVGKYINLSSPEITRPWVGLIVSNDRIDGCWTAGRLDFRR